MKTLIFIVVLLFGAGTFAAPPDFTQILEDDVPFKMPSDILTKPQYYAARHRVGAGDSLTKAEHQTVHRYTAGPDDYGARTAFDEVQFSRDSEELYAVLDKLPGASAVGDITEVFSAQRVFDMPVNEGDFVVAHGRPWSFSENPESAAKFLADKIQSGSNTVLYRVKDPLSGKPIASFSKLPQEAEILYTYGSSFQVLKVETKKITQGFLSGYKFDEVSLAETMRVPLGGTVRFYKGGANNVITLEELATDFQMDDRLRVRTYSPPSGCCPVSK
ncbi:MAG: hypothetical protein RPU59_06385 [Candidatus Sedimenticola sp. (ex Thyasira tokunagai)]